MDIGKNVKISTKARFDKNINPRGIHIGDNTWILACSTIFAHDYCRGVSGKPKLMDVYIGNNCVIGVNAVVMPGVKIGDSCVIGTGSIVTKDIPSNSIAVGNPAVVIRKGIKISDNGQILK